MTDAVFRFKDENLPAVWNRKIVPVEHDLPAHPLFADAALAELIEANPQAIREVSTMDPTREDMSSWKRGSFEAMSGADILQHVREGLLWLNIVDAGRFDERYQDLVDGLMERAEERVPGLKTFNRRVGILISSPGARVFYHCDVPGQGLLHVRGEKTLWIYPGGDPFLPADALERVVAGITAEEIPYDPSFEAHATRLVLTPGTGALWPLNWPHRVVNGPTLNVSMTVEYWTSEIRRHARVNLCNGVLRQVFGLDPRSRAVAGPGYWAKAAFALAWKASGMGERLRLKYRSEFNIARKRAAPPPFREAAE